MRQLSWPLACKTAGLLLLGLAMPSPAADQPEGAAPSFRAEMRADHPVARANSPVWVTFVVTNLTAEPQTLGLPHSPAPTSMPSEVGLPLAHVFSGKKSSAISIEDEHQLVFGDDVFVEPKGGAWPVVLAPHGIIGTRLELTKYYEALTRPGVYKVVWKPYGGTLQSEPLTLTVLAEQQARIVTDFGDIILRFCYDEAPNHVQSFIDLVRQGFYDNLSFHRVIPGGVVQGGDPRGDGRGIRPDGKRLKAEFSKIPFELGTVAMAHSPHDPDSASCQFFICLSRQPSFDGKQTAFARVAGTKSFETLRQIQAVPTGPKDHPIKPVYIRAISLENVPLGEREGSPLSSLEAAAPHSAPNGRAADGKPLLSADDTGKHRSTPRVVHGPAPTSRPAGISPEQ